MYNRRESLSYINICIGKQQQGTYLNVYLFSFEWVLNVKKCSHEYMKKKVSGVFFS